VKQLQKENGSLVMLAQRLRQSLHHLESQINYHVQSGCQGSMLQNSHFGRKTFWINFHPLILDKFVHTNKQLA
jgi:hypothetical protein